MPVPIVRMHVERVAAVALRREHVGEDHESPAPSRVARNARECVLHIGPRAVDEHGVADVDLRVAGAVPSTGATSAPNPARQSVTFMTSMSSRAQPVNGTAPVTPVVLLSGVSTVPVGTAVGDL